MNSNNPNISPEDMQRKLEQIQQFVNSQKEMMDRIGPLLELYQKIMSDEKFVETLKAIVERWDSRQFLIYQLGCVVFMFVLKSWLIHNAQGWVTKFFVSIVCNIILIAGVSILVPVYLIGPAYTDMLMLIYKHVWPALQSFYMQL